ncbi:uncharacterized protein Fot_11212 [Forsythia ovata]|uniref:Uncharacterized protein n=1 Tax=Forsythia ovata TaxID=205694 RepID=A0ABD1WJ96_9LAMI
MTCCLRKNVTENIELDTSKDLVFLVDLNDSETSKYNSSDQLQSVNSNSEEEVILYLEFNGARNMMDHVLEVGFKFRLKEELKTVIKNFSISNIFEVVFPHNDKSRLEARRK